ncbi:MAG: hypothetical protein ABI723_06360 [Bacteroidia bacterium]
MIPLQQKFSGHFTLIAMLVVMAMHIPFLHSDPDVNISASRDAFSDEALHAGQVRNYLNYGTLKMDEYDNLIKTPLLEAIYFLPLKFIGIHSSTTRLTVLCLSFLMLLLIWFRRDIYFSNMFIVGIVLLNYYVFNYAHYGLAEMLCTAFIFSGCYLLQISINAASKKRIVKMIFANALFAAAYYTKFISLYALVIPIAALTLDYLLIKDDDKSLHGKLLITSIASILFFMLLYIVAWILPNYDNFIFVYKHQPAQLDLSLTGAYRILLHIIGIFKTPSVAIGAILFVFTFLIAIYLFIKKASLSFRKSYLVIFCWLLCELPKLTMGYLPSRYMVSVYFAILVLVSIVLNYLYFEKEFSKYKPVVIAATVLLLLSNLFFYYKTYTQRKFTIAQWNEYFSHYDLLNKKVIGPWAPSLTWECKAYTYPVWYDFMNDKEILTKQKPVVIISEPGEEESSNAFKLNGIDLNQHADSVIKTHIGSWDVNIYWIKY